MSGGRYWAEDVNTSEVEKFAEELGKSDTSSGDFTADYTEICRQLGVTPCTFVSFDSNLAACKVSNCAIDLPSWRAAMITCGLANSPVKSLAVHHCSLSRQHVLDLVAMLDKRLMIDAVKLDNVDWGSDSANVNDVLSTLFATKAAVLYMSFRFNGLDDTFVTACATSLSQNLFLKYLNLSNNAITDAGFASLVSGALRCALSLQKLSIKDNLIEGSSLNQLVGLTFGSECTVEEDTSFKAIAKAAADKNKQVKDINKKRKKGNEPELSEVEIPERIIKIGKADLQLVNKTLKEIDLSWSKISQEHIDSFLSLVEQCKEQTAGVDVRAVPRAVVDTEVYTGFSVYY